MTWFLLFDNIQITFKKKKNPKQLPNDVATCILLKISSDTEKKCICSDDKNV